MLTTLANITALLPQVEISAASRPDEATVTDWIGETETMLMATLAHLPPKTWRWESSWSPLCRPHYVTPLDLIDSPIAASIAKDMVVHAVAARVLQARLLGIGDLSGSGAKELQQFYDDRITWLSDPDHPFDLPDAEVVAAGADCGATVGGRTWFRGIRDVMGGGYRPQPKMRSRF